MRSVRRAMAAAAAVVGAALATSGTTAASAQTGTSGELGSGGTAVGDVSLEPGDEDAIGVTLGEGSAFDVKFSATFTAALECRDPNGAVVPVQIDSRTKSAKGIAVQATGRHEFVVRSADGTQGTYSLTVAPKWPTRGVTRGTVGTPATIALAAGAQLKGKVTAVRGAVAWTPEIAALNGPGGTPLLGAPVAGKGSSAKLGPVTATASGLHELTISGGADGAAYTAAWTARAPRAKPAKLDLRNGLTTLGYEQDGVKALLTARCSACHAWTASAQAFKPHARSSLGRVVNGTMPQTGERLTSTEIGLIKSWIETGMKP